MSCDLKGYRIFIASPGGLAEERHAFRDVIAKYNDSDAHADGVHFWAVGWEDTLGGVGRPQAIINKELEICDYFVLVLWNRWGSKPDTTGAMTSGTQEEYDLALRLLADPNASMSRVVVVFKAVDPQPLSDPGPQLQQVLDFRKQLESEKRLLFETFDTLDDFRERLRRHLSTWRRAHGASTRDREQSATLATNASNVSESLDLSSPAAPSVLTAHFPTTLGMQAGDPAIDDQIRSAESLASAGHLVDAERLLAQITTSTSSAVARRALVAFFIQVSRFAQAQDNATEALAIDKANRDRSGIAADEFMLARIATLRGDLNKANAFYVSAASRLSTIGDRAALSELYAEWSRQRMRDHDYRGAEKFARRAFKIVPKEERLLTAKARIALGTVLTTKTDELDAAERHFKAAFDPSVLDPATQAICALNWGVLRSRRKDLESAAEMYARAADIWTRLGNTASVALAKNNLSAIAWQKGDVNAAFLLLRESFNASDLPLSARAAVAMAITSSLVDQTKFDEAQELADLSGHIDGVGISVTAMTRAAINEKPIGDPTRATLVQAFAEWLETRGIATNDVADVSDKRSSSRS